jgi:hypothetical protein
MQYVYFISDDLTYKAKKSEAKVSFYTESNNNNNKFVVGSLVFWFISLLVVCLLEINTYPFSH